MAVVPKSIMTFGASLLTARAAMRLKRAKSVEAAQDRIFMHLTQKLALGSVWKQAGIEPIKVARQLWRRTRLAERAMRRKPSVEPPRVETASEAGSAIGATPV